MLFVALRKPPQRAAADVPVPAAAPRPETADDRSAIRGKGVVRPKIRVEIVPEVAGRVVYVHLQLHAGGLISANEWILRIDPSDYELAVRRARAAVDAARARLDLELAAAGMRQVQGRPLESDLDSILPPALREPRIKQAEAALESAKAELAIAELQRERTSIVLPFDVMIVGETVSLGQYVDVGRSLATAYGTEAFEIEVPICDEDLGRIGAWHGLRLGGPNSGAVRSTAEVRVTIAGGRHTWLGNVIGTTGEADPASGAISVVVEVRQPLDISTGRPPLLPGTTAEVSIPITERDTQSVGDL